MTDAVARGSADRDALSELIARYAHYMDSGDFDSMRNLFAERAVFDIRPDPGIIPVPVTGRDTICAVLAERYAVVSREAQRRHLMTTTVVDQLAEDSAHTRTFLTVLSAPKGGGPLELRGSGVYHDQFVNQRDGWVISARVLYLDGLST